MDIITRLKFFMESLEIPSSQFADSCRIPRPTLSQLLSGRNKKISDEIITKIHDAYPQLSIPWLMFGEGEMRTPPNMQISEPQNTDLEAGKTTQPVVKQQHGSNPGGLEFGENLQANRNYTPYDLFNSPETPPKDDSQTKVTNPAIENTLRAISPDKVKRISTIVVFYDDKSFESFTPSSQQ